MCSPGLERKIQHAGHGKLSDGFGTHGGLQSSISFYNWADQDFPAGGSLAFRAVVP